MMSAVSEPQMQIEDTLGVMSHNFAAVRLDTSCDPLAADFPHGLHGCGSGALDLDEPHMIVEARPPAGHSVPPACLLPAVACVAAGVRSSETF